MNIVESLVNIVPTEIPYVHNLTFKNTVLSWSGSDTQNRFLDNLKNSESKNLLEKLQWDTAEINYSYNSNGFRDSEFDNRECGIALGCSFTEGIGLPLELAWPSILTKLTGVHVWNLGSGGASVDTVFRIFEYYVPLLKPKFVCLLIPPPMRFEYKDHNNGYPIIQAGALGAHMSFAKDWLTQPHNGQINVKKTVLAIDNICKHLHIPLAVSDSQIDINFHQSSTELDLARDLMHHGVKYQQYQAENMFDQLKKLTVI